MTDALADYFYRWKKAPPDGDVELPPAQYHRGVQEAFYWGEKLDNGSTFSDYGERPTPGMDAALSGFWRGRNRADNERVEAANEAARRQREQAGQQRYR